MTKSADTKSVRDLGPALNLHLPYPCGELQRAPNLILLRHGALTWVSEKLPGTFTQWNEHKTPQFEPMQREKEKLVFKLLAETEHGRQGASVNLRGIPGFLSGPSPLEHLWGSWRSFTANINGPCSRTGYTIKCPTIHLMKSPCFLLGCFGTWLIWGKQNYFTRCFTHQKHSWKLITLAKSFFFLYKNEKITSLK